MYADMNLAADLPLLESRTSSTESDMLLPETPTDVLPMDPEGYPFSYMRKIGQDFSSDEDECEENDTPKVRYNVIPDRDACS
jgi:hypothetical protein